MNNDDIFKKFIDKVNSEKKTQEEKRSFLTDLLKFGAAELYFSFLTYLTEEDLVALDAINDEEKAMEEITRRFQLRTNFTPEQWIEQLRERIAKGYLFPELATPPPPAEQVKS